MNKRFLNSMNLEEYIAEMILNNDIDEVYKLRILEFLNKYLFRGLFVVLFLTNNSLIIQVENDEDLLIDLMEVSSYGF
ncbi:hypothetical protein JW813_11510 [Clostridium botulinum]|uniref:Uncharacterized protein n=1 Tax=Clostridium botulinum (strain Eklund 17B / Type B) TaxID=935198 RepID=B2TRL5_CLOBB|nr:MULTISPECIES: hypothetical protein [Clostridium]ACD23133.1 hypothetical protein CLL_A2392 [Clostridium botulinum B str. Eklund 17B (NRP)]MBN1055811.1 hypothetical protein [Clostridium botulinum]MBY6975912.1 hypothetical protein [Clostridium botulinum]MBY7000335.1 hypothetical protein [Clostridium botulinum]MCR1273095.1 hypothetical protein [Clostridium botulinum]